jgi:hypothetical protein
MKNRISNILYILLFTTSVTIVSPSCSKDAAGAQVELSYNMLQEKTWFLDYAQSIVGATVTTRSYLGQSTYFINFLADRTTLDSDGIAGKYSVANSNGHLVISITGKTVSGNSVSYNYQVESMGAKNLVLSYVTNGTTYKMFYTAK